jgi:hypothetical protein
VKLAAGLLLMSIVVWWQVRMVLRSPYHVLRAVEALALSFPLPMQVFATSYLLTRSWRTASPVSPFWTYVRVGQRVRGRGRSGWTVGRHRDLFGVPGADHLDALRAGHASKVDSTV